MRRSLPLLLLALSLTVPAAARAAVDSVPVPDGSSFELVPGGIVVAYGDRTETIAKLDLPGGERAQLASIPLPADGVFEFAAGGSGVVAATSQGVFAGAPPVELQSCALDNTTPPIAVDGSLVAYGGGMGCNDLTVHDLASGTDTVLARGTDFDVAGIRYPYVAAASGYTPGGGTLQVYDLRTQAVVGAGALDESGAESVDVGANGRAVACTEKGSVVWADPGDQALHATDIPCGTAKLIDADRVLATAQRHAMVYSLSGGRGQPVVYSEIDRPAYDTDGSVVAWAGETCRARTVDVAPLDELLAKPARTVNPHCPGTVGNVTVKGRTASVPVRCQNGCEGKLELNRISDDKTLASVAVDPSPGKATVVKLRLSHRSAGILAKTKKVFAIVVPAHATGWRGGKRLLIRR